MEELYSPRVIRELLEKYNLAPLKALGQNFLMNGHVVKKIAQAAVEPGENVLEIGPGLGVLTRELALRAKRVIAIEVDAGMVRVLQETLADLKNVTILHQDALKTDFSALQREYFLKEPYAAAGNLPYYITSKCLMAVLEAEQPPVRYTAMVQKEVAQRLAALPGKGDYGALTASVAYYGQPELLFTVSGESFYPKPDVDSAVIRLDVHPPFVVDRRRYRQVVSGLFAMRRKTVRNNLKNALGLNNTQAEALLHEADIDPAARAEMLSPEDFARLAAILP